jgi:hypothetical protein
VKKKEIHYSSIKMAATDQSYFSSAIIRYTNFEGEEEPEIIDPQRKKLSLRI